MEPLHASQIRQIDLEHIWHPYTSMTHPIPAYQVVRAEGVYLHLEDGRKLVDGMSSWWCAIHGYNHPALNEAVKRQVDEFAHVMFGGIVHEPAARLCQNLVDLTPEGLQKVFLCDSGSVSVEVAIKMAFQYWVSRGEPGKSRLLSLRNGYHGDTFAAMSVCDPVTGMHHLFKHVMPTQLFAEAPRCRFEAHWNEDYIADFKSLLERHHGELAAVILEPVVQGTGGMRFYSPQFLLRVRELCDQYDVLLIADEIATGFGRTGRMFACEWADICPDIMCVGKSLTGGYMTLAATLCTERVSNGICEGEAGVLMHGPTFMGNPLACSVANASIELLCNSPWRDRIAAIETQLRTELEPCANLPGVTDVRVLGAIGVVELKNPVDLPTIQKQFVDRGVWVRPFGRLVYLMPPYVINSEELARLGKAIREVIAGL